MPLAVSACRSLCSWSPSGADLFACAGCGSQWTPSERWTPRQADGTVPPAVRQARDARPVGADPDTDAGPAPVSGASAGAAGSAGS